MDYYYSVKVIFVPKYVSTVVFKGGILGGARQFWGNPYLKSMIILFNKKNLLFTIRIPLNLYNLQYSLNYRKNYYSNPLNKLLRIILGISYGWRINAKKEEWEIPKV